VLVRERVRRTADPVSQLGINVTVLEAGQSSVYHAEANQDALLVLSGECRLVVEGDERCLRAWDFFRSPPWTEHAFVGAGDALVTFPHAGPDVYSRTRDHMNASLMEPRWFR
jgi:quercetin dioxygenase-like cupin family protein